MNPTTQPTGDIKSAQATASPVTDSELLDRIIEASYPSTTLNPQNPVGEFEQEELRRVHEARTRSHDRLRLNQGALRPLLSAIAGRKLTVSQSTITALDQKISRIRGLLSKQITPILHHPKFQRLEASWRGLEYLIRQTRPRPMMRLKVFNAREQELVDDFNQKAWTSSVLYRKVYENGLDLAGGIPFSALLGDYEFTRNNLGLLRSFSKVASVAHSPFIASVGPGMFDLKTFEGFNDQIHTIGKTLASRFNPASFPDWATFRASPDARFCVLTMPRVLMRLPYGPGGQSISGLEFNEAVTGKKHSDYLWGSAAYCLASRLIAAFDSTGWYSRITGMKGGGLVEDLPIHRHSGGVTYGVETRWPDPREAELANLGFAALVGIEGSSEPVYYNAPTVFDPTTVATSKDANVKVSHELAAGTAIYSGCFEVCALFKGYFAPEDWISDKRRGPAVGFAGLDNPIHQCKQGRGARVDGKKTSEGSEDRSESQPEPPGASIMRVSTWSLIFN